VAPCGTFATTCVVAVVRGDDVEERSRTSLNLASTRIADAGPRQILYTFLGGAGTCQRIREHHE